MMENGLVSFVIISKASPLTRWLDMRPAQPRPGQLNSYALPHHGSLFLGRVCL